MVDKNKQELQCFSLSFMADFKGFIKNGLDSSTLINLIVVFDAKFEEFKKRGFTFPPNLFFYHEVSKGEIKGVLINRHKFSEAEAKELLEKIKKQFNLTEIKRLDSDELYEKLVEEANLKIIEESKDQKLKIGKPDIIIIGGFLRENMNSIHSADGGFLKTCEKLNLNIIPTPKRDLQKENEIKSWMKEK